MCNNYIKNDFFYRFSLKLGSTLINNYKTLLNNYCLVILKPESLLTNKIDNILAILDSYGFKTAYATIKKLSQQQVFSLWSNGWGEASTARMLMNYIIMDYYPCVIMLLKSPNSIGDPCEFLSKRKGSICDNKYPTDSIRGELGAINNFLNFIHVSDTSEDVIREIAILLDYKDFISLCDNIRNNEIISSIEIINMITPYLKNLRIEDPLQLFKIYINQTSLDTSNNYRIDLMSGYNKKKISSELFVSMLDDNLIEWTWETIVIFSSFIETTDNM